MVPCQWFLSGWEFAHQIFSESLVFFKRKSESLVEKSKSLPSLSCHEWPEQIYHVCSLKKSDWAKSVGSDSLLGIKRGKTVKNCKKSMKNISFLCKIAQEQNQEQITQVTIFKDRRERFAHYCSLVMSTEQITHGCSFVKSNKSDWLKVTLFKEQWDQIAHSHF